MQSISPVFNAGCVEHEMVIALDSKDYYPIIILPVDCGGTVGMAVRFQLSPAERQRVAEGGDLVIMELTHGTMFTPIALGIVMPGVAPTGKDW